MHQHEINNYLLTYFLCGKYVLEFFYISRLIYSSMFQILIWTSIAENAVITQVMKSYVQDGMMKENV